MREKLKPVIIILFFILLLQTVSGQNKENIPEWLRQKFQHYIENVPREEIYIQTDREEYISGEYVWFSVYLIDRQTSKPSASSRIVYFELLNSENRPVVQKRIVLDKGSGPGEIVLPDTLSSGTYTIRAYTNWMKNFLPANCFMKDIRIYNALSKKAYRSKIYSSEKQNDNSESPAIMAMENLSLSVRKSTDSLELTVKSDSNFRLENNSTIYLFIQTHGRIDRVSPEKLLSDFTKIYVPKNQLTAGINQITFFDSKGNPVAETYIYSKAERKSTLSLTAPDTCSLRTKVSLAFDTRNNTSDILNFSGVSVSVAPESDDPETMNIDDYMIFGTEFGIQIPDGIKKRALSDVSEEEIDNVLKNVKSSWIDWSSVLSDNLPNLRYKMEREFHFLTGKLQTDKVFKADSAIYVLMCSPGKAPEFQYSAIDREGYFSFAIDISEEQKDLILMPDRVNKSDKLILESSFSDKYLQNGTPSDPAAKNEPSYIQMWSANYQVNKIYKITQLGSPLKPLFTPLKPLRFYGKPDIELVLADYISLPTMEEIFFELLPRVSMKKKKSVYEIGIADRINDSQYVLSPGLLLDGVVINDASVIANLNPEIVEKIDVIKDKYLIGKYTFFGIVNVTTKPADFSTIPLPDYMIRLPYSVIEPVHTFKSQDYSSPELRNSRLPDLRNTLYWNPSVKPEGTGRTVVDFWSSDIPYNYVITVQGIGPDGKLISLKKHISVTQNK
jgi:uncharacterized metal-binding protein